VENEQIAALINEKFSEVERRLGQMDRNFNHLRVEFGARLGHMDTKFDNLRIEVGARLDGMHSDIKKIAEGVDNVDEKLDRFRDETVTNLVDIRGDLRVSFSMLGARITDLEKSRS
jgi:tetrahydromethanopterin S-methyltransferase subunit G